MVLTERDRQVLSFLVKYRFCTREHMLRAGFFPSDKVCLRRLGVLAGAKFIRAGSVGRTRYYFLAPAGGLEVGLTDADTARRYRDAPAETVVRHLVWGDFALARGVGYLDRQEALEELRRLGANLTSSVLLTARGVKLYYSNNDLHVLLADTGQANFLRRVKDLARLPPGLFHLDVLVYGRARQAQLQKVLASRARRATIIVSTWKY
ncbi:MAG: hypothetical protein D9V47_09205 [Clostridia bacterium]|nr:MAG: hypothetical protein D9V47_09205 [Clostridia bacterium]